MLQIPDQGIFYRPRKVDLPLKPTCSLLSTTIDHEHEPEKVLRTDQRKKIFITDQRHDFFKENLSGCSQFLGPT